MTLLVFLYLNSRGVAEPFLALIIDLYSKPNSSLLAKCFTATRLRLSLEPSLLKIVEGALSILIV